MGEPNVFSVYFNWFIGIGITFSLFNSALHIAINFPFFCMEIYCKKTKLNKWL